MESTEQSIQNPSASLSMDISEEINPVTSPTTQKQFVTGEDNDASENFSEVPADQTTTEIPVENSPSSADFVNQNRNDSTVEKFEDTSDDEKAFLQSTVAPEELSTNNSQIVVDLSETIVVNKTRHKKTLPPAELQTEKTEPQAMHPPEPHSMLSKDRVSLLRIVPKAEVEAAQALPLVDTTPASQLGKCVHSVE